MKEKANSEITKNIHGSKYYYIFDSYEIIPDEGKITDIYIPKRKSSKQIVSNVSKNISSLVNFIETFVVNSQTNKIEDLKEEKRVINTITLNSNYYFQYQLDSLYNELKKENKEIYSTYTKTLSKFVINKKDSDSKIDKFEWTSNVSNLGFIFGLFKSLGYINFPKDNIDLATDNLLNMFAIDSSDRKSLREYLLQDVNKIKAKKTAFSNGCKKEEQETRSEIFRLPNREFLRKGKN